MAQGADGELEGDETEHVPGLSTESHCEVEEMSRYVMSMLYLPFHVLRPAELQDRKLG